MQLNERAVVYAVLAAMNFLACLFAAVNKPKEKLFIYTTFINTIIETMCVFHLLMLMEFSKDTKFYRYNRFCASMTMILSIAGIGASIGSLSSLFVSTKGVVIALMFIPSLTVGFVLVWYFFAVCTHSTVLGYKERNSERKAEQQQTETVVATV